MSECGCGAPVAETADRRNRCAACGTIYDRNAGYYGPMKTATKDSWKREPAAGPFEAHAVSWPFDAADLDRIRWGLVPRAMEEKWFAWAEGNELFLHRSWTGLLCFVLRIGTAGIDQVSIATHMPNHATQLKLARWIVESMLVGRDWPFPDF